MKRFLIFTVLFSLGISVFAQEYFWHHGKKIPLTLLPTIKYIEVNSPENVPAITERLSAQGIDVKITPLILPYDNFNNTGFVVKGVEELPTLTDDEDVLFEGPFFLRPTSGQNPYVSPEGMDTIGVTSLFNVSITAEDATLRKQQLESIKQLADENQVEFSGIPYSEYHPFLYLLKCTKYSAGNAAEMVNLFQETFKHLWLRCPLITLHRPSIDNEPPQKISQTLVRVDGKPMLEYNGEYFEVDTTRIEIRVTELLNLNKDYYVMSVNKFGYITLQIPQDAVIERYVEVLLQDNNVEEIAYASWGRYDNSTGIYSIGSGVTISSSASDVTITSSDDPVNKVEVYGIDGKLHFSSSYPNSDRVNIKLSDKNNILIFKIRFQSGVVLNRKAIIK